jgi:hypothetical protein
MAQILVEEGIDGRGRQRAGWKRAAEGRMEEGGRGQDGRGQQRAGWKRAAEGRMEEGGRGQDGRGR